MWPLIEVDQTVPLGSSVTVAEATTNLSGMTIQTQPRSSLPVGPPRSEKEIVTVVGTPLFMAPGDRVILHVVATAPTPGGNSASRPAPRSSSERDEATHVRPRADTASRARGPAVDAGQRGVGRGLDA